MLQQMIFLLYPVTSLNASKGHFHGRKLLSKAATGKAGIPFISISGSEFVEMFVGVGTSRVRDIFGQAKKNAPCPISYTQCNTIGKPKCLSLFLTECFFICLSECRKSKHVPISF